MQYLNSKPLKSVISFLLLALLSATTLAQEADKKSTDDNLTISKETTWFTEPLNEDGEVDYIEAANEYFSKGVTPENNLVTALMLVFDEDFENASLKRRYFQRIGIAPPSARTKVLVSFIQFAEIERSLDVFHAVRIEQKFRSGPWTKEAFPIMDEYIDSYSNVLDRFKKMLESKTRFYDPLVSDSESQSLLHARSHFLDVRLLARYLHYRSLIQLERNNVEAAMSDLLAIRKTAVLLNAEGSDIHRLLGLAMLGISNEGEVEFAWHKNVTIRHLEDYLAKRNVIQFDVDKCLRDLIDVRQRNITLSTAIDVSQNDYLFAKDRMSLKEKTMFEIPLRSIRKNIDWNDVLAEINKDYDSYVAALSKQSKIERLDAVTKLTDDWLGDVFQSEIIGLLKKMSSENKSERTPAIAFCCEWISESMVVIEPMMLAHYKQEIQDTASKLNIVLQLYKRKEGHFPDSIDGLTPNYLAKIPLDTFSNEKFVYKKNGDHFLLYSVGKNRKDDGGNIRQQYTDIGVTSDPKVWRTNNN